MYFTFIFISILIQISSGVKFRKRYQDSSSWSFQHPTIRYKKMEINGLAVNALSTIPMNTSLSVRCVLVQKLYSAVLIQI